MAAELPQRIGKYQILCELGQGGMAVLYLGRAVGPGGFQRLFALKTIHQQFSRDPVFVRMFLDEARLAARIHHPNAVAVYEVGEDDGRHYIAMEYVNGESLSKTMGRIWKTAPPFPLPLAIHVLEGVCEALHATHELTNAQGVSLGVVHRDVSPQNVMIGYDGIPRLMDFGVAKAADQLAHTRPGTQKGKVAYMAPEQIAAGPLDRRADIYALGVMLWETLAGRRLFKGKNDFVTAERIRAGVVPKLENFRSDLPEPISRLIRRAIARDPDRRPATARDFGRDLRTIALDHGLMTSSAEVVDVMQRVFAGRHQQRADIVRRAMEDDFIDVSVLFDDPSAAHSLDDVATVSGELSVEPSATSAEAQLLALDAQSAAPSARILAAVVTGILLVVVGVAYVVHQVMTAEEPVQIVVPVAPKPVEAIVSPESIEDVRLIFKVSPRRATVVIDGRTIANELVLPKSTSPIVAEIAADGFKSQSRVIVPDQRRTITIDLEPLEAVRRSKSKGRKKPKKKPREDRLLLDGDDL